MVVPIRWVLRDAKASTAMTRSGFIFSTSPCITSPVSTPVMPSTPGLIADTGLILSSTWSGTNSKICLVTIILSTTLGPTASGVTFQFPSPTIRTVLLSSRSTSLWISSANCFDTLSSYSGSLSFMPGTSRVI